MQEFCIYIRTRGGKPYILDTFNNISEAKLKLYEMISLEEERGRPYFVDNDFFNNKYSCNINLKYYCIKVREITNFEKYSEEKCKIEENKKIIYMLDYKKQI